MKLVVNFHSEAGFTFIELITIVLLISILATIAMLDYSGLQQQTKTDLVNADLKILRAAVRAYHLEHNAFPPDLNSLAGDGYIDENPDDKYGPIGSKYRFEILDINSLKISSIGPDGISDTVDDIVCYLNL